MAGFASSANVIIRNNRRKKIDKYKRIERYIGTNSSEANYNTASPEKLQRIKNRIQEQERMYYTRLVVWSTIIGISVLGILSYFVFFY